MKSSFKLKMLEFFKTNTVHERINIKAEKTHMHGMRVMTFYGLSEYGLQKIRYAWCIKQERVKYFNDYYRYWNMYQKLSLKDFKIKYRELVQHKHRNRWDIG